MAACRARHAIVHHHDYNYYSNEYTVHGGHEGPENAHMCPDIFNAVVMRCVRAGQLWSWAGQCWNLPQGARQRRRGVCKGIDGVWKG